MRSSHGLVFDSDVMSIKLRCSTVDLYIPSIAPRKELNGYLVSFGSVNGLVNM